MRDLTVIFHDDKTHSGATSSMLDLLSGLSKNYTVRAVIPKGDGDLADFFRDNGIDFIICRYFSTRIPETSSKGKNVFLLIKNILKIFISLPYFFMNFSFFSKSSIIYSNTSDNYFGIIASLLYRKKLVTHIREFGIKDQGVKQFIGDRCFYNLVFNISDRVIVISKSLENHIVKNSNSSYVKRKLSLIYDDVQLDRVVVPVKFNSNNIDLLVVGTLCEGKGQDFLIESIYRLKSKGIKVNLGVAGNDKTEYGSYLKNKVNQLDLNNEVIFHGFCENMTSLREKYSVCVVASSSEAFGRVTIEGMANSQLIIASDSGANPELVKHGITGFLYRSGDIESFCSVLSDIITKDEAEVYKIIQAGKTFSNNFRHGNSSVDISKLLCSL